MQTKQYNVHDVPEDPLLVWFDVDEGASIESEAVAEVLRREEA